LAKVKKYSLANAMVLSIMRVLTSLLLLSNIAIAQENWCDWKCKTSIGIYSTAITLDANSSWGQLEKNKLLRKEDHTFSPNKYFTIHIPILVGTVLLDKYVYKNKQHYFTFIFRTACGALILRQAIKNYQIKNGG
jgi:hypothetical protein